MALGVTRVVLLHPECNVEIPPNQQNNSLRTVNELIGQLESYDAGTLLRGPNSTGQVSVAQNGGSSTKGSATLTSASPTNGDTFGLPGVTFTLKTATITSATPVVGDTLLVTTPDGKQYPFVFVSGTPANAFQIQIGGTDTITATNIAAALNATQVGAFYVASSSVAVVTLKANVPTAPSGAQIQCALLSSSGTRLAVTSATGVNAVMIGNTDAISAAAAAAAINFCTNVEVLGNFSATSAAAVVTVNGLVGALTNVALSGTAVRFATSGSISGGVGGTADLLIY